MNNLLDQEGNLPSEDAANGTRKSVSEALSPLPLTRVIILTLIAKFPSITGYALMKKKVPEHLHPNITLKTGTVYSELRRLEDRGILVSKQDISGRRERRYTITDSGLDELTKLSQQIQNRRNFVIGPLLTLIQEALETSEEKLA